MSRKPKIEQSGEIKHFRCRKDGYEFDAVDSPDLCPQCGNPANFEVTELAMETAPSGDQLNTLNDDQELVFGQ